MCSKFFKFLCMINIRKQDCIVKAVSFRGDTFNLIPMKGEESNKQSGQMKTNLDFSNRR